MSTSNPNQYGGFTKKQYLANLKKTLAQIRGSSGKIVTNEQKLVGNDPTTVKPASIPSGPNTTSVPSYVPPAYVSWVQGAAESTGLPASVVAAQINDESGFDPTVTSPPPPRGRRESPNSSPRLGKSTASARPVTHTIRQMLRPPTST